MKTTLTHLACSRCGEEVQYDRPRFTCNVCNGVLLARYSSREVSRLISPTTLKKRGRSLWKYFELLPLRDENNIVSLGEVRTPIINLDETAKVLELPELFLKDESMLPTGSFKARGMTAAVSKAKELGAQTLIAPSAGNAGSALAAYCARANLRSVVVLPKDTPKANISEAIAYGAEVSFVDGQISDAGKVVTEKVNKNGWYDCSTMKEPCRVEGKKTMGYELAEQFDWKLPDVIVYPTGGGTGIVGMWKAFKEMEELGWTDSIMPRFAAVQSSGCAPITEAWEMKKNECRVFENAATVASGLRVPKPVADYLILSILRETGGCAVVVPEETIMPALRDFARREGILLSPEAAATVAALPILIERNLISPGERIVLFNTGSGLKYLDLE